MATKKVSIFVQMSLFLSLFKPMLCLFHLRFGVAHYVWSQHPDSYPLQLFAALSTLPPNSF